MNLVLLLLTLTVPAFALNQTYLQMPPDREYMNFVLKRYLAWHVKHFEFPADDDLQMKLLEKIDHWLVPGSPMRQFTMTHSQSGKPGLELRLFVHPDLRKLIKARGLPPGSEVWFAQWDNQGSVCYLSREQENVFSAWCRKKGEKDFRLAFQETLTNKIPEGWPNLLPYMGDQYVTRAKDGKVTEVSFFNVVPHPSRIPRDLYRSLYLHTKEVQFSLDRISTSQDGKMKLHYP